MASVADLPSPILISMEGHGQHSICMRKQLNAILLDIVNGTSVLGEHRKYLKMYKATKTSSFGADAVLPPHIFVDAVDEAKYTLLREWNTKRNFAVAGEDVADFVVSEAKESDSWYDKDAMESCHESMHMFCAYQISQKVDMTTPEVSKILSSRKYTSGCLVEIVKVQQQQQREGRELNGTRELSWNGRELAGDDVCIVRVVVTRFLG